MSRDRLNQADLTLGRKLLGINWLFVLLLTATASVGFAMLYSAANGSLEPWAMRQMTRFGAGLILMLAVALMDIRLWLRYAYVFYAVTLALLILVEFKGTVGMGAQRWIDLGFFRLQPSELMKIALVLALARYFHSGGAEDVRRIMFLLPPLFLVAAPVALVLKQPDLGTAAMLALGSAALAFVAGAPMWIFAAVGAMALAALPVGWNLLHGYQKERVLTFFDPERDPLGAGYHITQSKIALGSGGISGKGFMQGTQSHLQFLPEKQTDFIFTMLAEEFGLIGGLVLIALYVLILAYGFYVAVRCRNHFGRLLAMGITATFFIYAFINIAMVMGLLPVVGAPLPLVSYGGTALLSLMFGFGLLISAVVHRDVAVGRRGPDEGS